MLIELLTVDTTTSLFVGLLAAIIVLIALRIGNDMKLPPGPYGLPIVGYLPFLTRNPHLKMIELKKKYGPVFSLRFGSQPVVFLCDYPSIKEAFSKDAMFGRVPDSFFNFSKETQRLGAIHDLGWKEQRRFALHALRDLGFGKSKMEIHIQEEIEELMSMFEQHKGQPLKPETYLTPSASNNISSLLFGKRRRFDDPKRQHLDKLFQESRQNIGGGILISFFPILEKFIRATGIAFQDSLKIERDLRKFVKDEIEEHQKTFDPNNIRDYIDGFLVELEKKKDEPDSTFKIPVLDDVVQMFFGAGGETIMGAIDWLMFISAAFPDIQKRVQSEIDSAIGDRFPSRSDYLKMPYSEAVICEMLRWRGSLPLNLPRYTLEDVRINSYVIPKHTQVIAVFWGWSHDPDLWGEDVKDFKPERFLSKDGKQVKKPEYFIPFSIGKRSCPGEALANVEIFMYFVAILQKFNIRFPDGFVPDLEGKLVFGLQAKHYKVHFEVRNP